jgi:hypothetical protein
MLFHILVLVFVVVILPVSSTPGANRQLLNDEQKWHFVTHGFLKIKTDLSPNFHSKLFKQARDLARNEPNPGL